MRKNGITIVNPWNKDAINLHYYGITPDNVNQYDLGGALQLALTGTLQLADGVKELNNIGDKSKLLNNLIQSSNISATQASSTADLLAEYNAYNPLAKVTWKDFTNKGGIGSTLTDMVGNGVLGAMSGSSMGPIGAIGGAGIGLATGLFTNLAAKAKAKREAKAANIKIAAANINNLSILDNKAIGLDNRMLRQDLNNFTGWEAAYGGPLNREFGFGGNMLTNGSVFSTGLTFIDTGGTHEQNTNGGVPAGVNPQDGIPNLVEEGEVIYDDYVFSNRLRVAKELMEKYKLNPENGKNPTYALAIRKLSKEISERPNDPISKNGLEAIIKEFALYQEEKRAKLLQKKQQLQQQQYLDQVLLQQMQLALMQLALELLQSQFVNGGLVRRFDDAGSLVDPTEGIIYTPDEGNLPELTVVYTRPNTPAPVQISDRGPINPDTPSLPIDTFLNYIEPLTPITPLVPASPTIDPKANALEVIAERKSNLAAGKLYFVSKRNPYKVLTSPVELATKTTTPEKKGKTYLDFLRFAPVVSQAILGLTDAFGFTNRPTFNLGKRILAANNAIRDVGTEAVGTKLGYRPVDLWAAINNLNAQAAAQRALIRNSNNRVGAAGSLLAAAYNLNKTLGELYANMENANWSRLASVALHNTGIDQSNRQAFDQAAQFNANLGVRRAANMITAALADDAEETAAYQAIANNRTNLANTLGAIGKERLERGMLKALIKSGYAGTPNQALIAALARYGINVGLLTTGAKNGGKLNRKKKKGLTY